jgi:hypothetical protein
MSRKEDRRIPAVFKLAVIVTAGFGVFGALVNSLSPTFDSQGLSARNQLWVDYTAAGNSLLRTAEESLPLPVSIVIQRNAYRIGLGE